jgi:hypothetical protein
LRTHARTRARTRKRALAHARTHARARARARTHAMIRVSKTGGRWQRLQQRCQLPGGGSRSASRGSTWSRPCATFAVGPSVFIGSRALLPGPMNGWGLNVRVLGRFPSRPHGPAWRPDRENHYRSDSTCADGCDGLLSRRHRRTMMGLLRHVKKKVSTEKCFKSKDRTWFRPGSNWGSFACEANGLTNFPTEPSCRELQFVIYINKNVLRFLDLNGSWQVSMRLQSPMHSKLD